MSARFLEISVRSDDLLGAMTFYRSLGFQELNTNDAWPHPYAALSDGQIVIGLHGGGIEQPTITLTQPDLSRKALQFSESPHLEKMAIDQDAFNELCLNDSDRHALRLLEARTFSPAAEEPETALFGELLEVSLPVRDALVSAQFWAPFSNQSLGVSQSERMHMRLNVGGLPIGLSETIRGRAPQLCYRVNDPAALGIALDKIGRALRPCRIGVGDCIGQLQTDEGLSFAFLVEDFLDPDL